MFKKGDRVRHAGREWDVVGVPTKEQHGEFYALNRDNQFGAYAHVSEIVRIEPPPPAFKVGDRVRTKDTQREYTIESFHTSTTGRPSATILECEGFPRCKTYATLANLEPVDPDPIAAYRRPSEREKLDAVVKRELVEMHKEHPIFGMLPVQRDPIAAAKAKCAEMVALAKRMGIKVGPGFEQGVREGLALSDEVNEALGLVKARARDCGIDTELLFPSISKPFVCPPKPEPLPEYHPTFACEYCRRNTPHADSQAGMRCTSCSAVYMGVQRAALEAPYEPVRGKR